MIAGICGSDPTREMEPFLQELKFWGFSAIMNYPTIGGWRGKLRADIEAMDLGVRKETETLVLAKELGFYTIAYAYDEEAAIMAAEADVDIIICHLGMTVGGSTGSNLSGVQAQEGPAGRGRGLRQRPDWKDPRDQQKLPLLRARRPDLHAGGHPVHL